MMISPGTPRIQSRSGTMLASFLSAATVRARCSQAVRDGRRSRVGGIAETWSAHNSAGRVTCEVARVGARIRT